MQQQTSRRSHVLVFEWPPTDGGRTTMQTTCIHCHIKLQALCWTGLRHTLSFLVCTLPLTINGLRNRRASLSGVSIEKSSLPLQITVPCTPRWTRSPFGPCTWRRQKDCLRFREAHAKGSRRRSCSVTIAFPVLRQLVHMTWHTPLHIGQMSSSSAPGLESSTS